MRNLGCATCVVLSVLLGSLFLSSGSARAETQYIQSEKAPMRSGPAFNSALQRLLPRGQSVEVVKKDGMWAQVKLGAHVGYVSTLSLSATPIVDSATVAAGGQINESKEARSRPRTRAMVMGVRGLNASDRAREGREQFPVDYNAIEKLENQNLDPAELNAFEKSISARF